MLGDPSGYICPMKFTVDSTLYEVKGLLLMTSHYKNGIPIKVKKCLKCVTSKILKKEKGCEKKNSGRLLGTI